VAGESKDVVIRTTTFGEDGMLGIADLRIAPAFGRCNYWIAAALLGSLAAVAIPLDTVGAQLANPRQFDAVFSATAEITRNPARCPALTVNIRGTGLARHLGEFTAVQSHCIDPSGPSPLAFTDGIYDWTNGRGDRIHGSYAGRAVPTPTSSTDGAALVDAAFTILRGAGRFENARGGGGASGLLNLNTGGAFVVLDGEIHNFTPPR
jgi:hypothetical protein